MKGTRLGHIAIQFGTHPDDPTTEALGSTLNRSSLIWATVFLAGCAAPPPVSAAAEVTVAAPVAPAADTVSRGGAPALPQCAVTCQGQVTPELAQALRTMAEGAKGCFTQLLRTTDASGSGLVEIQVNEQGQACHIDVKLDGPLAPMEPCVRSRFEKRQLPAPAGGCLTVRIPISFSIKNQLTSSEIAGVVTQNRAGLSRQCWQPALSARTSASPVTASVGATIVINPSGDVASAVASGAESEFPGLSSCVAAAMKTWRFPPSGGPSQVDVPIVFDGP